jgi:hypothetical protein
MARCRSGWWVAALLAATGSGSGARAQTEAGDQGRPQPRSTLQQVSRVTTVSAEVQGVDLENHELTLKGPRGDVFTVDVSPENTRIEALKPGDQVHVRYSEAVAVELRVPGQPPSVTTQEFSKRSSGSMPGGVTGRKITATGEIVSVDAERNEFTIKTPSGTSETIAVDDPQNQARLRSLKPGDRLQLTYTSAIALSVTPRGK